MFTRWRMLTRPLCTAAQVAMSVMCSPMVVGLSGTVYTHFLTKKKFAPMLQKGVWMSNLSRSKSGLFLPILVLIFVFTGCSSDFFSSSSPNSRSTFNDHPAGSACDQTSLHNQFVVEWLDGTVTIEEAD